MSQRLSPEQQKAAERRIFSDLKERQRQMRAERLRNPPPRRLALRWVCLDNPGALMVSWNGGPWKRTSMVQVPYEPEPDSETYAFRHDDGPPPPQEPEPMHAHPKNTPTLLDKMRALADTGHERAPELREKADALEAAVKGFYAKPQTVLVQSFVGAWARARGLWCECTGERLV